MTDIVERLRGTANWMREEGTQWKDATCVYDRAPFEAADEIELRRRQLNDAFKREDALRAELAAAVKAHMATIEERDRLLELLREARVWIDFGGHHTSEEECYVCERLARIDAALGGEKSNG